MWVALTPHKPGSKTIIGRRRLGDVNREAGTVSRRTSCWAPKLPSGRSNTAAAIAPRKRKPRRLRNARFVPTPPLSAGCQMVILSASHVQRKIRNRHSQARHRAPDDDHRDGGGGDPVVRMPDPPPVGVRRSAHGTTSSHRESSTVGVWLQGSVRCVARNPMSLRRVLPVFSLAFSLVAVITQPSSGAEHRPHRCACCRLEPLGVRAQRAACRRIGRDRRPGGSRAAIRRSSSR